MLLIVACPLDSTNSVGKIQDMNKMSSLNTSLYHYRAVTIQFKRKISMQEQDKRL